MNNTLRQMKLLLFLLTAWLAPQIYSYRGASVHTDGSANAGWRIEADSEDYDARRKFSRSKSKFADKRHQIDEGIAKHRRGVDNIRNGGDPMKQFTPPTIELDPVQGLISDLRSDKPIVIGFDQGDRALAADLNILPQSMAPRNPAKVDEKVQIVDPNAQTAVLVLLPTELPSVGSFLTRLAVEATTRAECLIFQPKSCEFDPLSNSPQLTIPDDAIPFEIPGPGKHDVKLPEDLQVDPTLPIVIVQKLQANEHVLAIMQKVDDVRQTVLHRGPVRAARDVIADVYYSNYKIGTETYFQNLPLIKQQQIVSSIHMSHEILRFSGGLVHLVEEFGEDHFAVMNGDDLVNDNVKLANSRQISVRGQARHRVNRMANGDYSLGYLGY